jgi:glycosyltransferase involved in cell wall biosynthesis
MAAWKPTIASPVGANPSIVTQGETGFLAETPADWLTALRTLRDDSLLRRQMGARGRQRVAAKFDIPAVIDELAEFLTASAQSVTAGRVNEMEVHRPSGGSLSARPHQQSLSN